MKGKTKTRRSQEALLRRTPRGLAARAARSCGCTLSYIWRVLARQRRPSPALAIRLADFLRSEGLRVTRDDLVFGYIERKPLDLSRGGDPDDAGK